MNRVLALLVAVSYRTLKKSTTGFSDQNGWTSPRYNNWVHDLEGDIEERLSNATS